MKIGIDCRSLQEMHPTGVTRYTTELLRELLPLLHGHEVVLFFSGRHARVELPWPLPAHVSIVHRTMPNKFRNALWVFGWGKPIDVLCGGVDVLFMPCPLFARVSKNARFVLTFHDVSFERMPEVFSWYQRVWHKAVGHRRLAQQADTIIAVSRATAYDVVNVYGVSQEKVHVVYSGITQQASMDSRLLPEAIHQPYVVMVGTKEKRKNILAGIAGWEAAKRAGSALQLVIIGRDGFGARTIHNAISTSPYAQDCVDMTYASDEQIRQIVAKAEVALYPSWYEGFGLPILEAMSMGVPVITSAETAMAEVAGDAALLVHPSHPEEIRFALQHMGDPAIRLMYIEKGKVRVQQFDWKQTAQQTSMLLK